VAPITSKSRSRGGAAPKPVPPLRRSVLDTLDPNQLHRLYAETRSPELRDELVRRHERLAQAIASRFCNHTHDRDDRGQAAMVGLLNAVERFDPDRGVSFSTFAWATITGELKRFHRGSAWTPHVARSLQELHLRVARAVEHLTTELGRSPTLFEVAAETGDTPDDVAQGIELNHARSSVSIDGPSNADGDGSDGHLELASEADSYAIIDNKLRVEGLLSSLPPRTREIVRLRFGAELSQSQIAARVGLSQMHVSRLLAQALRTMRESA
jgi:RNA polymerase sigma-B factor